MIFLGAYVENTLKNSEKRDTSFEYLMKMGHTLNAKFLAKKWLFLNRMYGNIFLIPSR